MAGSGFQRLFRRGSSRVFGAALAAGLTAALGVAPISAASSRPFSPSGNSGRSAHTVDVTGIADLTSTRRGVRLAEVAHTRFARQGFNTAAADLRVLRDSAGILVVPRGTSLTAAAGPRAGSRRATLLTPIADVHSSVSSSRDAFGKRMSTPLQMSWTVVYSGCYERLSDNWSFIDHCAQILRLQNDGDPSKDSYALERWATAGANWPWVLKSAAISAYPTETSPTLAWVDWVPRSDRTGPCQAYSLRILSPLPTTPRLVERCEQWDVTKASRGGDFRLDWRGCTCTHDRELAFSVSVTVAQGRLPAWYVPAEVHGYPF